MMMNDGERWVMTEKRFLNDDDNAAAFRRSNDD
jgi:hypothetical protein